MAKVKRTGATVTLPTLGVVAAEGDTIDVPSKVAAELAARPGWSKVAAAKKAQDPENENEESK